jgi:hypothetical protein
VVSFKYLKLATFFYCLNRRFSPIKQITLIFIYPGLHVSFGEYRIENGEYRIENKESAKSKNLWESAI